MLTSTLLKGAILALLLGSCSTQVQQPGPAEKQTSQNEPQPETIAEEDVVSEGVPEGAIASEGVIAVETSESASGSYTLSVTVQSPDTGCDAYANWWEVITPEGDLLYRRILAHSHVDEQPFTRSGGPVAVGADDEVIVRSHMHPTGYSTQSMKGTVSQGFAPTTVAEDFAQELATAEPQPGDCAF